MRSQYPDSYFLLPSKSPKELEDFLAGGYGPTPAVPRLAENLYFSTAIFAILYGIGTAFITLRIITGTFWIARVRETRGGRVVLINSPIVFLGMEGIFITVFMLLIWWLFHELRSGTLSFGVIAYSAPLVFLPLLGGAYMCGVGIAQACPGVLAEAPQPTNGRVKRAGAPVHAALLNSLIFVPPTIATVLLVIIAIRAGTILEPSYRKFTAWKMAVADLPADTLVIPEDLADQWLKIWREFARGWWWEGVAFVCWTVIAILFFLSFGYLTIRTVLILRQYRFRPQEDSVNSLKNSLKRYSSRRMSAPRSLVAELLKGPSSEPPPFSVELTNIIRDVTLMAGVILLAILGFSVISGYWSARLYEYATTRPADLMYLASEMLLSAMWIFNIAAGFVFWTITRRTFNPMLTSVLRTTASRSGGGGSTPFRSMDALRAEIAMPLSSYRGAVPDSPPWQERPHELKLDDLPLIEKAIPLRRPPSPPQLRREPSNISATFSMVDVARFTAPTQELPEAPEIIHNISRKPVEYGYGM